MELFKEKKAGKLRKKAYGDHKYSPAKFSPVRLPDGASARMKKSPRTVHGVYFMYEECWGLRFILSCIFVLDRVVLPQCFYGQVLASDTPRYQTIYTVSVSSITEYSVHSIDLHSSITLGRDVGIGDWELFFCLIPCGGSGSTPVDLDPPYPRCHQPITSPSALINRGFPSGSVPGVP